MEHLGKGGMATVYRAVHTESRRIVAIKIFEPNEERTSEVMRRLRDREVRMLLSVQHPNIVKFYDMGDVGDSYYYTMEFVENSLLVRMRGDNDFSFVDRVNILRQTANALAAIHHQGIVHRDVKPGNILLDEDPSGVVHVKLTDLGIAKSVSETDIVREQSPTRVPGTAKYLCPEQVRLEPVDGRADIFSLGVVAYELLTGQGPFQASTSEEYLVANVEQHPAPAHEVNDQVPPFLGRMIEKMLAKDREERYDSDAVARDLDLAYQHLISGAELVERTNPVSLFYTKPDLPTEAHVAPRAAAFPSWWALAAAAALVVAGGAVVWKAWPAGSPPSSRQKPPANDPPPSDGAKTPAPAQLPAPTASEMLQEAADALETQQYWRALALLDALNPEQLTVDEREGAVQHKALARHNLAQRALAAATRMLVEQRDEEARVVLEMMRKEMPGADSVAKLDAAIQRRLHAEERDRRWEELIAGAEKLTRSQRYGDALKAYGAIAEEFDDDPAKAAQARRDAAAMLERWGTALRDGEADQAALESYLATAAAAAEARQVPRGAPSRRLLGAIHLKLGRLMQARIDERPDTYDEIMEHYRRARLDGSAGIADEAALLVRALSLWKQERVARELIADLKKNGFRSKTWGGNEVRGGTQKVLEDGSLQLGLSGEEDDKSIHVQSRRLDNIGSFSVAVALSAPVLSATPGAGRAGIEVRGTQEGHVFQILFDGASYRISLGAVGAQLAGGAEHKEGEWHVLRLEYDRKTESISVVVDGERKRSFTMALDDVTVRVFLSGRRGAKLHAAFKDFAFEQRPRAQ